MNNGKFKILLVEDNPIAQMAALMVLRQFDLEIDTAITGNEAIKLANENEYDVIFMDLGLPDIGGYEVTKTLRASGNTTHIMALTAHQADENKAEAYNAGVNGYLVKPLTEDAIKDLLASS